MKRTSLEVMLGTSTLTVARPGKQPIKGLPTIETPLGILQADFGLEGANATKENCQGRDTNA